MFKKINLLKIAICLLIINNPLASAAAAKKPSFIATFPSTVISGTSAQFCIRFQNLNNSSINLTISDDFPHSFNEIHFYLSAENINEETCVELYIDIDGAQTDDRHFRKEISVRGLSDDSVYAFNDSKHFVVKKTNYLNIVETDKSVYKPGQVVRIRILSLNSSLKPVQKVFDEIFIEDASNSRVVQWRNAKSENGLIDLNMLLSDEPNLGMWTINIVDVEAQNTETFSFEVKKYVLPKFETTIDHDERIRFDESILKVTVCGKYSYGKGVQGTYKLKASTSKYSYKTYKSEEYKKVEMSSFKVKGCHRFEINPEDLGIGDQNYLSSIKFEATVIESDTGISANASSSLTVTHASMNIEVEEVGYYKPGFPIEIRAYAKSIRGTPLVGEKLEVLLENGELVLYSSIIATDETGSVLVRFNPYDCQHCGENNNKKPESLKLTVRLEKFLPDYSLPYWKQLHNPQIIRYIKPWISGQNSYIQIFRDKSGSASLKCDQTVKLQVRYSTIEALTDSDSVYFQFQSRSSIVNSGHFNVESDGQVISQRPTKVRLVSSQQIDLEHISLEKDSARIFFNKAGRPVAANFANLTKIHENIFEIKFNLTSEMSPELKVLVFAVQGGEIIPDHMKLMVEKCLTNKVDIMLSKKSISVKQNLKLEIKTEPSSVCGISAIDKSVSFMGKRNAIRLEQVFEKLNEFQAGYDYLNNYQTNNECSSFNNHYWEYPRPMPRPVPIPVEELSLEIRPSVETVEEVGTVENNDIPENEDNNSKEEVQTVEEEFSSSKRKKRMIYPGWGSSSYDATKSFRDSSIVYLSDLNIHKECRSVAYSRRFKVLDRSSIGVAAMSMMERDDGIEFELTSTPLEMNELPQTTQTVRWIFPETWLWNIKVSDQKGLIESIEKSPDSITDWQIDAYCFNSNSGLGVAETQTLNVFQSMFISLSLPYSVVKGEVFPVKATVFNYANTCVPIRIELMADKRFNLKKNSSETSASYCICEDEKVTHEFHLQAEEIEMNIGLTVAASVTSITDKDNKICKKVGKVFRFRDIETKFVIVEPEGIPKEHVENSLILFKSEQSLRDQNLDIALPDNVVPDSARVYLTVTGDAMGPVLKNLDKLVQQPTGCGEQNMVKFAPIVSVVNYLNGTGQMTLEMDELTKKYLKIGYQRQLTYRHPDSSFSAFGPNSYTNETGGTWLTAFVLRCLADAHASEQIEIDVKDLVKSFELLLNRQDKDGSFKHEGAKLYSSALAGGLKDLKMGLTAYVLVSLVKTSSAIKQHPSWINDKHDSHQMTMSNLDDFMEESQKKLDLAFIYLINSIANNLADTDTYTLALSLYAMKIQDPHNVNSNFSNVIEEELDMRATHRNGQVYWQEADQTEALTKSANLEITAYVLLAKLHNFQPGNKLGDMPLIVKWINSQRNSLGGFYSTQDTVVALDALSKFASAFYMKDISLKMEYEFNEARSALSISNDNRLLVQKFKLNSLGAVNRLNFDAEGYGSALVQLAVKYNLMVDTDIKENRNEFEFGLITTKSEYGSLCDYSSLVIFAKYVGQKETSSMAIISLKLPSGWNAIEESVEKLKSSANLKRFEAKDSNLALYFDQIDKTGFEIQIDAVKKFTVKNRKPGLVSVYDYYESSELSITQQFDISEVCTE